MAGLPVYDGDSLLLYCPEATGHLYNEPLSSASNLLTIFPSREDRPHFPNIDFATFRITHGMLPNESRSYGRHANFVQHESADKRQPSEPMTIVYGSTIKLQHQASGKYLSLTPTTSAWLDNGKPETSLYRLVPPRQEKGWGEDLTVNDSIRLESIYYKGYRIQCVNNPLEASYHLVLAVTGTIFSIKSHSHKSVTLDPQAIKGGSVIMLSSLKIDGYVSIKGSFVNVKIPEKFRQSRREVGLRRWRQGFFKVLPYSGDTFLQFEKTSQILTGNPFVFGEECRIKHLPTQMYISVSRGPQGLEIVMQDIKGSKSSNGSELFKILSANKATTSHAEVIALNQIALQHVKTKKLLSVNVRPVFHSTNVSQQDQLSQWFNLILEDQKDEFLTTSLYEVLKVEEDAILDIYHVTGMSSFLCNCLKKIPYQLKEDSLHIKMSLQSTNIFQEVIDQMKVLKLLFSSTSHKKRLANMLRTLQTIDAMVSVLIEMTKGDKHCVNQACSSVCSALEKYVESGNLKSRHYLAKRELLNSLMGTVGQGFGTDKVLIGLSKDDAEMGDLMQEFLISLIGTLNTEDPEVAELMTTLAFSGRRFNKEIQDKIYEITLKAGMVHNYHANSDVRFVLDSFVTNIGTYLETTGVAANRQSYTYDYMNFTLSSELSAHSTFSMFDEQHLALLQTMSERICQYLSSNEMHVLYAGDDFKGRNSILAQMLGVLAFLIDYGAANGVSEIVRILIRILDGNTDEGVPGEPFHRHDRYNVLKFSGNKIVFKIKTLALQSLQLILKRHFHMSLENLLYDFKCLRGKGNEIYISEVLEDSPVKFSLEGEPHSPSERFGLRSRGHIQRERSLHESDTDEEQGELPPDLIIPSLAKDTGEEIELVEIAVQSKDATADKKYPLYIPPHPEMKILLDNEEKITKLLTTTSHARLRYNFKSQVYPMFDVNTEESQRLCRILLDLINYDDTDVCLMSTELIYDLYSVENSLLSDAEGAYFTTPYSDSRAQLELMKVATMTDDDQFLSKMLRRQVDDVPKLLSKLEEFSDWCVSEQDETEPNASNQGVAYSCGLFAVMLEYVLEYGMSADYDREETLCSCFTVLQRIARKNVIAQRRLFSNFHDFLEAKTAIASMTRLLNEVFSNNPYLCSQLSEADIKQIFYTAVGSSNPEHHELTVTLRIIIENTEPATPLQEYIAQLVLDHWEDNLGHLLGQENQSNRLNLLQHAEDEDPELRLLLNVTDLLASCTTGECQFAESACHQFFDLDELLLILVDDTVEIHRKLPFARVLTWTFLNTERDSALACSQLASSRNFWSHIESQIHLIDEEVSKQITSLSSEQKKILQVKLTSLSKSHWSINNWMAYYATHFNSSSSTNINGNLLYIIEGVIPLLAAFCNEIALHLTGANELCTNILTIKETSLVKDLGEKLLMLHRLEVISATEHVKKLRQCIISITKLYESLHELSDFNQLALHSLNRRRTTSSTVNLTNPEALLNQDLQLYITQYAQAYDGNHDKQETASDDIQESLTIPRGPSFEKLIELFTDKDEDLKNNVSLLKATKLVLILRTLIQKLKRQGLRCLERANLERVTLKTLQLLCGVIFKRISKVPRGDLQPDEFQVQYRETIQPIQKVLLNEGIVEILIGLLHHPKDDIAFQVLACLNVLLYPGNEEAQKKITAHVNQQDRSLFLRVHQILRRAQSRLSTAKMSNALAQIAALIYDPMQDQGDVVSTSVKLLERNKSVVFGSLTQSMVDLSPSGSDVQLNSRKRTAAIEGNDGGNSAKKFSTSVMRLDSTFEEVQFVDHRITMALNVLSWLCDGQQKDMQDVLREDKTFSGSNIVSQVAFLLHGIAEHSSESNITVAQGALQALIEMCAGNYSNQVIAFKGQVVVSIDTLLQEEFTNSAVAGAIRKLKSSCIELLEVLLEETDENSPLLAHWIISYFDISNFLRAMFSLWQAYSEPFNISNREQLRNSVFRAFHVLRRIADYKNTSVNKLVEYKKHSKGCATTFDMMFSENTDEAKRMWQYCQLWSRTVEIVYKAKSGKKILTRAYFPYDPHKHLNENEKDTILLHVKRNTPQEKLSDLLQWTEAIRSAHEWKKRVKKSWRSYWLLWASTIRHFILFWLTIFLNSIVFFSLKVPSDYYSDDNGVCASGNETCNISYFRPILSPEAPDWYDPVRYSFGAIHLILSIWMVLQYYSKHWSNMRFEILFVKKTLYNAKKGLLRRKYIYQFLHILNKVFCCGKVQAGRPQPDRYFQIFFFSFEPIYRILFLFCSIIGLASNGYFYCGCMVYIFLRNYVLLYVLRAVRKSALQLITIFVLGLVVIYIYAVISFALIPNYFSRERDEFCETIFQCFVTITRLGLLETLGTAINVRPPSSGYQPNFSLVGWRTLYDLIFFIVVTTLGLNIVIAILVDRFSDLREEKDKIDEDNHTRCFICSIKKDVFERHGLNFQEHCQEDHNVWNYIHFVLYLDTLHTNDHNALEKYVSEQVPSKSNSAGLIEFFPMFKAKILPNFDINMESH